MLKVAKSNNLPLTQETFVGIMESITDMYEKKNRHRIDREKEKSWRTKWELENDEKLHVPKNKKEESTNRSTEEDPQRKAFYDFGAQRGIH